MKQNIVVFICIIASCIALYLAAIGGNKPTTNPGGYQPIDRHAPPPTKAEMAALEAKVAAEDAQDAPRPILTPDQIKEAAYLEKIKNEGGDPREMSY